MVDRGEGSVSIRDELERTRSGETAIFGALVEKVPYGLQVTGSPRFVDEVVVVRGRWLIGELVGVVARFLGGE